MLAPELAPALYRELRDIATHAVWAPRERVLALAGLLERLFFELTRQEQLVFSSLFARVSYVGHRYQLQPETLRLLHTFRRAGARAREGQPVSEREVRLGMQALSECVLVFCQAAIPPEVLEWHPAPGEWSFEPPELWDYKAHARVVALRDQPDDHFLLAEDEENPGAWVRVRYNLPERNDNFRPTLDVIRKVFGFPVTLSLLDVDIDRAGDYRPRAFVVEPDFLVDVTAVAECFRESKSAPYHNLVKKFLPYEVTPAILLGNIANFFLDRLLAEPGVPWETAFRETFQLFPLIYSGLPDQQVKEVRGKAQKHFLNIRNMAASGFQRQQIAPEHCVLEPTFYSAMYGLQGRLDLFYREDDRAAIVELKSGTPFKPNSYGIQRSHFTQTLLYDLLVRSVYGAALDPAKYILYSGVDVNQLRFAPTVAPEQWEALQVRNQLVAIERLLARIRPGDDTAPVLNRLRGDASKQNDFLERDYAQFEQAYSRLTDLERRYFNSFAGFIAREQWLAKVGDEQSDALNGHAALWRSSFSEKQQAFAILSHLEIARNLADQPDPVIVFRKTDRTNPLANFRVGDIAVLYPFETDTDTVLEHQVIKCTITALTKSEVTVQLRYRQFNLKPFPADQLWNLEPDMMDMGFTTMYRNLFEWAKAKEEKRKLIMTVAPPAPPMRGGEDTLGVSGYSAERSSVEQAAPPLMGGLGGAIIASRDYFLLWGPPGTGKTSVMLRALAEWVLRDTADNLLLLAYTNRAVDEICEALDSLGGDIREQYLRLGSRYSTAETFRGQLLSVQLAGVNSRAELREILDKRRIVVSTVASFSQNDSLLALKKFQRLIVDEASQLLEPQLIGLLPHFEHFILIGDHRQLPAVTAQRPEDTRVDDAALQAVGLTDLRDSYFERLYRRCQEENWHWAYGRLDRQGRMHADIMDFPNRHFYGGLLKTLSDDIPHAAEQHRPAEYRLPGADPEFERLFALRRVAFWPTPSDNPGFWQKTSKPEAEAAVRLVKMFKALYAANGLPWRPGHSLGIITPWRAQIAQLRDSLAAAGLDPDELTIDTVERYQGGARDIILISCCVHAEAQLVSLVSRSAEGVDRKLNVALTRARRHVVVLGDPAILERDATYRAFLEAYRIDE